MSHKGKVFTTADLPNRLRPGITEKEKTAWLRDQTKRYRIVAHTRDGEPLIAEELEQRALDELSSEAKAVAGMLHRQSPAVRAEIVAAFDAKGNLKIPFKRVK